MSDVERTLQTSRVLLDEVTRIYKSGGSEDYHPDKILSLVAESLKPYKLTHIYDPATQKFLIG